MRANECAGHAPVGWSWHDATRYCNHALNQEEGFIRGVFGERVQIDYKVHEVYYLSEDNHRRHSTFA
jgi:hypothetical protein